MTHPTCISKIKYESYSLAKLKAKMEEYIANGVQLGWLIDSKNEQALVYRRDSSITQYPATAMLSGEDIVPGFILPLKKLL
ncbi:Uma2 family endonuclease [Nostoc sp.]|uniref:Uma2 family endonuclease n=1 Tax=Nostoc sp. TaxID=1180 RepID=UPI002FF4E70A